MLMNHRFPINKPLTENNYNIFRDYRKTGNNLYLINEKFPVNSHLQPIYDPFFNITYSLFPNIKHDSVIILYLIFIKLIEYTNLEIHPNSFNLLYSKFLTRYNKNNIDFYNNYILENFDESKGFLKYYKPHIGTWNLKLIYKIITSHIFKIHRKNNLYIKQYNKNFDLLRHWPEIEIYRKIFLEIYDELLSKNNNLPNIIYLHKFTFQIYECVDYALNHNVDNINDYLHEKFDLYPDYFIALVKNEDSILKENYLYFDPDRNQILYVFNSKYFNDHVQKHKSLHFFNRIFAGFRSFKTFLANISDNEEHKFFE